jgi:hypothetical protein
MLNRTLILTIAAVIAIVVGVAASFFELIVLGVIAAVVAVGLGLRRQPTNETPGR